MSALWFKLPWGAFIAKEVMRKDAMPFVAGGITTFLMLGVGLNLSITDADRMESPYHKQFVLKQLQNGQH